MKHKSVWEALFYDFFLSTLSSEKQIEKALNVAIFKFVSRSKLLGVQNDFSRVIAVLATNVITLICLKFINKCT